jgi:hypothetical protein
MEASSPLIETVRWGGIPEFVTAVVCRAGLEFAIFDSTYPPPVPIVISSETTPRLLGEEYVAWRPAARMLEQLIGRAAAAIGISRIETVTLKSPPLLPSAADHGPGGQLLLVFRAQKWAIQVSSSQDALNLNAQDIHNCYGHERWGELLMSVSRVICKCLP